MLAGGAFRVFFGLMTGLSRATGFLVTSCIQIQCAILGVAGAGLPGVFRLHGLDAGLRLLRGCLVVMGARARSGIGVGTGL